MSELQLDRAGRRRSPATMPGCHAGRRPRNKGLCYPADPPNWLELGVGLPVGPLFCVFNGRTRGRQWSSAAARADLRRTAVAARVRRRFAPHQLRHAHAVEMARDGVPLVVIQRRLGHSNLGITSVCLQWIDNAEIIDTVHARRASMIPVSTSQRL